jgi:hypothetical protein
MLWLCDVVDLGASFKRDHTVDILHSWFKSRQSCANFELPPEKLKDNSACCIGASALENEASKEI